MDNYYLQVVKNGEEPKWPRPEEELDVESHDLGGGYTQYWAYEKGAGGGKLPLAELLANEHTTDKPAILIDAEGKETLDSGKEHYLTLVVVKNGHAWGKTESSLANLEDNLNTLLDFAKNHFNINIEHFMTTSNIPEEVEKKLDEIEKLDVDGKLPRSDEASDQRAVQSEEAATDSEPEPNPWEGIKKVGSSFPKGSIGVGIARPSNKSSSKFSLLIPLIVILLIFGGTIFFKDQIFSRMRGLNLGNVFSSPTPTPVPPAPIPTPTPEPEVKRGEIKVRVLNGTTKSGAAAALKEILVEKGWVVIKTGNAKNQKFEQTTISVKKDMEQVLKAMVEDIKGNFDATNGAELDSEDAADMEVVIGKK